MSGIAKGKRTLDDDALPAEDAGAPPSKAARKDSDDDGDDIVVCEISKSRRVSVRNWHGRIFIDIREFYLKDGKQMPGKKGIALTMDQWNVLRDHVEEIDKAVNVNNS